jgi:hypothetical protein
VVAYGLTLSAEEHGPAKLVEIARAAENAGFDFVSISDHYHPWIGEQGHSPFVWSVLGALAAATESIEIGVGVTCPTVRIHTAIERTHRQWPNSLAAGPAQHRLDHALAPRPGMSSRGLRPPSGSFGPQLHESERPGACTRP